MGEESTYISELRVGPHQGGLAVPCRRRPGRPHGGPAAPSQYSVHDSPGQAVVGPWANGKAVVRLLRVAVAARVRARWRCHAHMGLALPCWLCHLWLLHIDCHIVHIGCHIGHIGCHIRCHIGHIGWVRLLLSSVVAPRRNLLPHVGRDRACNLLMG